jgi:hypothetical protein
MKTSKWLSIAFVLLLLCIIGHFVFDFIKHRVPEGMVLVPQSTVDSLDAYIAIADSLETLANSVPDTVYLDTVYVLAESTATTTPTPIEEEDSITTYSDTLSVEGEVNAWVTYKVRGYVEGVAQWGYTPIIREIETIIEKKIPYPVIETIEVKVPEYYTGHYLSLAVGGNDKMFNFGVDYDLVRENRIYGLQYRRYGEYNVYGVKVGINLAALFKR